MAHEENHGPYCVSRFINTPCSSCGREEDGHWYVPCPSDDCPSHEANAQRREREGGTP